MPIVMPDAFDKADRLHFETGVTAFRAGEFYLAHDEWEEVWQGYRGADRRFLQALIHVAVGTYHAECANPKGARSQMGKAADKMQPYLPTHWGIDATRLLALAGRVAELADGAETLPEAVRELRGAL